MHMYLDRNDISFRKKDEKDLLSKKKITVFRPGNRIYPKNRWYSDGEVIKARIIDTPWNDNEKKAPVFSNTVKLVKIETIKILQEKYIDNKDFYNSLRYIQSKEELRKYLQTIYQKKDFSTITKIDMTEVEGKNLINNEKDIRRLFDEWIITFAKLPEKNTKDIEELFSAKNFSFTFINHDYAGITPKMRNHISEKYDLGIKNSMVIIQPEHFTEILDILQKNIKYIWWWLGVWFKDIWRKTIKEKKYWFINPIAEEMQSINFIAHFWDEIHGYNSDATWYVDSLCDKFKEIWSDIQRKNIILLWAGGTARGIALELMNRWAWKIIILNRTIEKAEHIAKNLNKIKYDAAIAWDEQMIFTLDNKKIDAIINLSTKWADGDLVMYSWLTSTEGGIKKNLDDTKIILERFKSINKNIIISDINLTKTQTTPLIEIAKEEGLFTLDGKLMVIYQWIQAIWTIFWDKIIQTGGTKEEIQEELLKIVKQ